MQGLCGGIFLVNTKRKQMDFLCMYKYGKEGGQHTATDTAYETEHIIKQGSKNNRMMNWRRGNELYSCALRWLVIKADPFSRFPRDWVKNNSQHLKKTKLHKYEIQSLYVWLFLY